MSGIYDLFLDQVEAYFGKYKSPEVRGDVRDYLSWRVAPTKAHLASVLKAMKLRQEINFGPPGVAVTREAIELWEKEMGCSLRPARSYSTAEPVTPEEAALPTPEDLAEVRRIVAEQAKANPVAAMLLRMLDGEDRKAIGLPNKARMGERHDSFAL